MRKCNFSNTSFTNVAHKVEARKLSYLFSLSLYQKCLEHLNL